MLEKIIDFSIRNKLIVILFTFTIALFGLYSILNIPIGAVPDITNNQVQVITTSGNLSTQEIEQFITAPVELEMANLPGVQEIRSVSKFGLSVVTIVFEDRIGTYLPRQLIAEKIKAASANIPEGFGSPEMGPITTGLGEIYQYILDLKPGYEDRYSAMELRTIQDWIVRRQLSGIDGVVEVNSWGGYLKQYEVAVDPARLRSLDISLAEVFDALKANNSISGGAYIEKTNQSYFIRGDGQVKSLEDIGRIVIKSNSGTPVTIDDVAQVHYGYANRFGAITANAEGEKVLGQVMMLKNANSKKVINEVKKRVAEIQDNLPEGVFINPVLERSELISKTSFTVVENLVLGCLIVILVVIVILGNLRSALVIASMIPLALLFTLSMMFIFKIDANLMSLGALDFGIIIDGAVIIVEYIAIRLNSKTEEFSQAGQEGKKTILDKITFKGASRMMSSAIFGQIIILIVFIPILSLRGVEGKMFRPMALSFSFAIIGAMILGFTWLPVASSLFLKPAEEGRRNISRWIMNIAYKSYYPVIRWSCNHKRIVLGMALISLILTGIVFSRMGGEFVPTLDEGDFVIQPVLKTGTSLSKTIEMTTAMEKILLDSFPEVSQIVCRIGAAEVPTDPMSMEEIDMIIKLHPKEEWTSATDKEELADKFKEALSVIPGIEYEFTQPIEMRFNELITGVRADIAIKIFGEDLEYLNNKAIEVKNLIQDVPGAADIILEKTAGLPQMSVKYDRQKVAYYGIDIATMNNFLAMAFGGQVAGSVFEGEKRFDLVIRLQEQNRVDIENIRQLQVPLPDGNQVSLAQLADISLDEGPAKISRENTHRRVVVSVNVRNRDLQSVVEDIQARINDNISLLPGNYIAYGGQFENLQNASRRLMVAVPLSLLLIFIFLHFAFKSIKDATLIFTAVPLSTVGGVFLLWLRGMPFSVSAGIGFIALFGIAVLNGIVLIEHLKDLEKKGFDTMRELILKGTRDRLRPVMLTAAAAATGFLPMAVSTGAGAEVQRPLATVVIGGLVTSTMLTMIALPLLFEIFHNVTGIKLWPFRLIRAGKKGIKGKGALGILLLLVGLNTFGQAEDPELKKLIELGNVNNMELKALSLKVMEAEALIPASFNIDKTLLYYSYDQNNIAENGYPIGVLGIEQSMAFPGIYSIQRKMGMIGLDIARAGYERKKMELEKSVSLCYYEIQFLLNKQKILLKTDSLYSGFRLGMDLSYSLGEISLADALNARAKQEQLRISVNQVDRDIQIALLKLKALVQTDSIPEIVCKDLTVVESVPLKPNETPEYLLVQKQKQFSEAALKLEKTKFLPDISMGFFNGTNQYSGADNYMGFQLGLGIPLFFGEQKAKVKAGKLSVQAEEAVVADYLLTAGSRSDQLMLELQKSKDAMEFYQKSGKALSAELIRVAESSYRKGEIDYFRFIVSLENAWNLDMNHIENILKYNQLSLELKYLSK